MSSEWDVVVVGGGAAGLSAALMLGRARRRTLVIDAGSPRNRFAAHMHGVLGHEGLDPRELLARGRAEVQRYGVEVREGSVERVDDVDAGLAVTTRDGATVTARAVIVATGLSDTLPDVPGLAEHWGTRVLHCPYCHGWEVRDQRLGVLLTSPLGVHQAELVRQWSSRVTVLTVGSVALDHQAEHRLRARGTRIVTGDVVEVRPAGEGLALRTAAGEEVEVDALFTAPAAVPHDAFLAHLALDRTEGPAGSVLAVDATGRTSHPRVWAAGNVVDPRANVPASMGAGSFTGGAVNGALVADDADAAAAVSPEPEAEPAEFWENRYAGTERAWSGRVNATLMSVVADLAPGRALDLGCGEGGDAVWLARHGWDVTGIDISPTAVRRATEAARAAGLDPARVRFLAVDLTTWSSEETFDLVTASFFQSPVELDRWGILRSAAARVSPGGHLLVISHAAPPPWASFGHHHGLVGPDEELTALGLDPQTWAEELVESRFREATGPDGTPATLEDGVVLVRRR